MHHGVYTKTLEICFGVVKKFLHQKLAVQYTNTLCI